MTIIDAYNKNKIWPFPGGIHPAEMKTQSSHAPLRHAPLVSQFFVPVNQHAGKNGEILVNVGDSVLKGQPLTAGDGLRELPVHAPTSGIVRAIAPYAAVHPSGMQELTIHIEADGQDQWREQQPLIDFQKESADTLLQRIYQAGIAGLGGAVFPTAAKIQSAQEKVKLLVINGAECEPYITCDDRLMRDEAEQIVSGISIVQFILQPEKTVIAIEDNKPEAIKAMKKACEAYNKLHSTQAIDVRVIPTKYPSGAAKQLIYLLTGQEVPSGRRSSSIGVLMLNVSTCFAIKRAVIHDEPLIERVVTLTGNNIREKGNYWVCFGTPMNAVLQQAGYRADVNFPIFVGGPLMGFILPQHHAPITKVTNCLIAPDAQEYSTPEAEQACIRCGECSNACPVSLLPQQLYWYAREEEHTKSQEYHLKDCIECGICAYVCPSHIPLVQYFRQEKAKIWQEKDKQRKADEAKARFEARQQRLDTELQARKARTQKLAETRRETVKTQQGEDPVAAALARLRAKQAEQMPTEQKIRQGANGEILPDNSEIMAERKARRLAKQAQTAQAGISTEKMTTSDNGDKSTAVVAAIARAKAKQQASQENTTQATDDKKAAVAAAIARAKAKKLQRENENV